MMKIYDVLYFDYKFCNPKGSVSKFINILFSVERNSAKQEILQLKTLLLGLGPRYFFNHYPGH